MTSRASIVASLREIAALLQLQGANRYKARAFERGARALEASKVPIEELVREGRLRDLPGIGHALAHAIEELHTKGTSDVLESLRAGLPRSVLELSQVSGIGLHALRVLHDELGIESVDDLRAAASEGRLRGVKGFSERREAKILDAIDRYETAETKVPLHVGLRVAETIREELGEDAHLAGDLRRFEEVASGIEIVVGSASLESSHYRLADGTRVHVTACAPPDLGPALAHRTGPPSHWNELVARAASRGLRLEPTGLYEGTTKLEVSTEQALYERLGLTWTPPELRDEGAPRVDARELVARDDVKGFVHCHTTWSDGKNTIEEMARAAEALGASFLTITDHSSAAHYAGGLDADRLREQWDEIAAVQERVSVRLLRGTEADILADGALDWPDAILERLDVVIASIHQRHKQDERKMTERVLRAVRHPIFKIWGHPLGRLVTSRPPIPLRVEEVLDAIADSRAAIEINGDPHRLDLEPRWARAARARGIPFVLSVDAHSVRDLSFLDYAVGLGRRAGLRRDDVLNTKSAAGFADSVRP
jgi:DNA polymerase (family X)